MTGQVSALERLIPELDELRLLLADANTTTVRVLRDFANNHPDLERLAEILAASRVQAAQFDLFDVLGLWWQEDVHSRTLTWLLDPQRQPRVWGTTFSRTF